MDKIVCEGILNKGLIMTVCTIRAERDVSRFDSCRKKEFEISAAGTDLQDFINTNKGKFIRVTFERIKESEK